MNNLKSAIEKSDAMLYAPSINDIKADCESISLNCYILELTMVLEELGIRDDNATCVFDFMAEVSQTTNSGSCPPCEVHALENSTIFLQRLKDLLEKLNA